MVLEKGIETLIESFNLLTRSLGKIFLVMVGADEFSDTLIVWVNAPDITHLDMAEQFGMSLYDSRDVPLEMSPSGEMRVTISIESTQLDSPRAVEDVLDRNQKYQRLFSDKPIDYSELLDR